MHRLCALVVVVGCGGTAPAPVAPAPRPERVALADPCDGGETKADPCAGGEAPQQVAIADPCDGGEATGHNGLQSSGEGGGGGGVGKGGGLADADGLGGIGTIGHGSGGGSGFGAGAPGSGSPIGTRDARIKIGAPTIVGELPAAVVTRVAKRYQNQLRFCYERVLAKNPALAGSVSLMLVVSKEGSVAQAKATGLTTEVEDCIAGGAMRWSFPKPGKGIAKITFPLTFSPPTGT